MLLLGVHVEVPSEEGSRKRSRGRPPTIGHFHEDVSSIHFFKILMAPKIGVLALTHGFRPYLGPVSRKMTMKTTTWC
jgi:hypothetical protein